MPTIALFWFLVTATLAVFGVDSIQKKSKNLQLKFLSDF